jgi:succinyl-CoA synthetase beta subunit
LIGFSSYHAVGFAKALGYSGNQLLKISKIIQNLYTVLVDCDAELVEINPLGELEEGSFVALDAKITIDDNSLFRQKKFQKLERDSRGLSSNEIAASKNNLAYVKLDGDIGVVGNGAGLVMATIDVINLFGGSAANFLDVGGGADIELIVSAIKIVVLDKSVKVVFVNILGGITRCDVVANALLKTMQTLRVTKPFVVRLVGTNENQAKQILSNVGIESFESMELAAEKAVNLAKGVVRFGHPD